MIRERVSFAPEACVKGKVLREILGDEPEAEPIQSEDLSGRPSGTKFESKLERWSAETSRRLLEMWVRDLELFALLSGRDESSTD